MAESFKIEIPIEQKTSGTSSRYDQAVNSQQKTMNTSLKGILIATGAVAAIWTALSPILTPLLKLLSLLLLIVFLPLLPYIKDIAKKIGEMVKNVKAGQTSGDGESPMSSFAGGLGALFGDWKAIGALMGAAFLLSLGGAANIAGVLFAGLSFALAWNTFSGADSSSLEDMLKGSLGAGLAAGVAALAFGAGIYALPIGLLTFGLTLGLSFMKSALSEEDSKKALLEMAAGSALLGAVVGGIVALLGLGLGVAGITTVAVGTILFTFFTGIRAGKKSGETGEKRTVWEMLGLPKPVDIEFEEKTSLAGKIWQSFTKNLASQTLQSENSINNLGFMIGSPTKGSYPIVYSLIQAENEWVKMTNVSSLSINSIIENLNKIPRKITTIHEIRTVRTSK